MSERTHRMTGRTAAVIGIFGLVVLYFMLQFSLTSHYSSRMSSSIEFQDQQDNVTVRERILMFVHVGKTGGSSLNALFTAKCSWLTLRRAKKECLALHQGPGITESTLSQKTKSILHIRPRGDYNRWINQTTTFLFSLRSPVSRTVSAFDYGHVLNNDGGQPPRIRKFYECFSSAEDLAQSFSNKTDGNITSSECQSFGKDTLMGHGRNAIQGHISDNTAKYLSYTILPHPEKEIMAVRTEHLWNDLLKVDMLVGGSGNFSHQGRHFDHGSSNYKVKSELTLEGRQLLCKALKFEIAVYKNLIWKATNLQDWEKNEAMAYLKKDCGGLEIPVIEETNLSSH